MSSENLRTPGTPRGKIAFALQERMRKYASLSRTGGRAIIILLPLFGLLVGVSVAWSANYQIGRGSRLWRDPYLPGMLLYEVLVMLPPAMVLFVEHPASASLYLLAEPAISSVWLPWAVALGTLLFSMGGFLVAAYWCRARRKGFTLALLLLSAAGLVGAAWLAFPRWLYLADGIDFRGAPTLLEAQAGLLLVVSAPVTLGGWLFLLLLFIMEGRRIMRATRQIAAPLLENAGSLFAGVTGSQTAQREFLSPSELERLARQMQPPPSSGAKKKPKSET